MIEPKHPCRLNLTGVFLLVLGDTMKTCDLHTHTHFSDGSLSPTQLVQAAEQANLSAVALCDHNTITGLPEFLEAGKNSSVETIAGIEFSTSYENAELHLIMLFVKPEHYAPITELMQQVRERKEESNRQLVSALLKGGFEIDYFILQKQSPDGYINRAHIAAEMVRLGYAESMKDAFSRFLKPSIGYYIPPKTPDVFEMIRYIRNLGGVSILAHPFLNLKEPALEILLPQAKACGLDAMETYYSRYSDETTLAAQRLAAQFDLLPSGGSDFHGSNKPDISLGIGTGNLHIPYSILEDLKNTEKTRKF